MPSRRSLRSVKSWRASRPGRSSGLNAQINNVFVAADRFAEFVGQMNKAIEAMPAHEG